MVHKRPCLTREIETAAVTDYILINDGDGCTLYCDDVITTSLIVERKKSISRLKPVAQNGTTKIFLH